MNIVVVGDGKVGYTLTASLSKEGHDVTVIDNRPDTLRNTTNELDVICIEGNGVSYAVQSEAGVQKADLLIAATSADEINMLACMVAKKLGAKHTIARVRDPQYQQQMFFLKEELGLSVVVNPEQSAASEISRLMRFVPAIKAEPFAKGRIDLVEFKVKENSPLDGVQLSDFYRQFKVKILVCAARRGEEVFIPKGNFIIRSGDKLTILAAPAEISNFFRTVGTFQRKVRDVMVVGGGRIAYYLARQLIETGIHVKIIEKDEKRCNQLFDLLPKATILHGDGTDHELLSEEGLDKTDALIALTGIDEENIILSMYANSLNVDKVVTKVNNARLGSHGHRKRDLPQGDSGQPHNKLRPRHDQRHRQQCGDAVQAGGQQGRGAGVPRAGKLTLYRSTPQGYADKGRRARRRHNSRRSLHNPGRRRRYKGPRFRHSCNYHERATRIG